jgi:hypothetical protein
MWHAYAAGMIDLYAANPARAIMKKKEARIMIRKIGTFWLILLLLVLSGLLYLLQYLLFWRATDSFFYFLQDLAFVPISVLLVTLGINTVLVMREKQAKLQRVSIVVNEFFAEVGYDLITALKEFIADTDVLAAHLQPVGSWNQRDFNQAVAFLNQHPIVAEASRGDLSGFQQLLSQKKSLILRLFENANLMEHDRFTDMLWAVYHVYDELRHRASFQSLPASDMKHLSSDIQRAAQLLLIEWIEAMRQLKMRYPYLYSLAVRTGPFSKGDPVVL